MTLDHFLSKYKSRISSSSEWLKVHWQYVEAKISKGAFKKFLTATGFSERDANGYLDVLGSSASLRKLMKAASETVTELDAVTEVQTSYPSFDLYAPAVNRNHSAGRPVFVAWLKKKFGMTTSETALLYRFITARRLAESGKERVQLLLGFNNTL
jgi:hypothetical protein